MITKNSHKPSAEDFENAAYIAGVLVKEKVIDINRDEWAMEEINIAIRLIAACLRDLRPCDGKPSRLPFEW